MPRSALNILVVDDNQTAAQALARVLQRAGDSVQVAFDGQSAIDALRREPPDVVLTDLKMEPVDGLAVLEAARAAEPPIDVIVFTAFGGVEVAVRAMRMGARDFLTKPVSVEQIQSRLEGLRRAAPPDPVIEASAPAAPPDTAADFVALAPASIAFRQQLTRAAEAMSPVWIEGEVGSGRSFATRTLHQLGRRGGALVFCDAGQITAWPERGMVGLIGVDELSDEQQRRLARQLRELPPTLRLVGIAEPGSRARVAEGTLRADLYFALAVVTVAVPPLRQRTEDIAPLFRRALAASAARYRRPVPALDDALVNRMAAYGWPGNLRELQNLAERWVIMGVDPKDIPQTAPTVLHGLPELEIGFSLSDYLESEERAILVEALRRSGGDRAAAGRLLGVERNALRYKLTKYGLADK